MFDFSHASVVSGWSAIDDSVMGGVSASRLRHAPEGHAVFEGTVSLERNGGFASVRSRPQALGVGSAAHYIIEVRGDGKRYRLNLRTDDAFDGVNYQAAFDAPASDGWTTVTLPVERFVPSFRGRPVPSAPPLDPARVRQAGLMIADRQSGPFALAVRTLRSE